LKGNITVHKLCGINCSC